MDATATTPPAILMNDVSVGSMRDQDLIVVRSTDWQVAAGEFWAIAGLQGAGKSDFLMMTAGLMPPRSGRYELFGEHMPIYEESRLKQRLRLGLVFETGQLFNQLTVGENVAVAIRYHENLTAEAAKPRVAALLEAMELEPWADSTPGAIGRNWQKRVGLARALALQPDVLLVDNPLAGLDLRHSQWWLRFLSELSRGHDLLGGKRVTVIVTTAELQPWRNRATRFAVLREKKFVVLGSWKEVESAEAKLLHELLPETGEGI